MSYFLIFLAVMLAAAVAMYVVGLKKPAGAVYDDGLAAPVDGLPPVLLPAGAAPADIDRLRFALGLRGYRMDQVDEVLDRLRDEIAAKDGRVAELEAALAAAGPDAALAAAGPDAAAPSPDVSGTQPDGDA